MVLLLCLTAAAQDAPKAEAFLGYSYVRANPATSGASGFNLNGGSGSFAFNPTSRLGIVADFGGYHVGNIGGSSVDANLFTYMFGPRFSWRGNDRFTPFAQALFGAAHSSQSVIGGGTSSSFAMTIGGGLDAKLSDHFAVRVGQLEYFLTRFPETTSSRESQNNLRFSTGVVFRF